MNATDDYAKGSTSYYEGVFLAAGKSMSVCLASNSYTDSEPFISSLESFLLVDHCIIQQILGVLVLGWLQGIVLDTMDP